MSFERHVFVSTHSHHDDDFYQVSFDFLARVKHIWNESFFVQVRQLSRKSDETVRVCNFESRRLVSNDHFGHVHVHRVGIAVVLSPLRTIVSILVIDRSGTITQQRDG